MKMKGGGGGREREGRRGGAKRGCRTRRYPLREITACRLIRGFAIEPPLATWKIASGGIVVHLEKWTGGCLT